MNYQLIRSFDNYVLANITLSMLQDAGIDCHLRDELTITIDPLLSPMIGGMKLMVIESQAKEAEEMLDSAEKEYLQSFTCPNCKKQGLEKIIKTTHPQSVLQGFWNALKNGQPVETESWYQCLHCKKRFDSLPEPVYD
jgi:hypothetical protein